MLLVSLVHTPAAPATAPCGLLKLRDGARVHIKVLRAARCRTARRVLRAYLQSHAACDGSACVREHFGWTCASASNAAYPRLASCTHRHGYIAAYAAPPPGVD